MNPALIREIAKMNLQKNYLFAANDIGDWDGEESQALTQLNRIMKTIEQSLDPLAISPAPSYIKNWVLEDWCGDLLLLQIREEEIVDYVYNLLSGFFARRAIVA